MVISDVDSMTCAGAIAIPNPRVCLGRSVTFTCTTNGTGGLVWRTSAITRDITFSGSSGDTVGTIDTLDGFTANVTVVMDALLTSTLTVTASDEVRGAQVTCLDGIGLDADRQSAEMPLFVEGELQTSASIIYKHTFTIHWFHGVSL